MAPDAISVCKSSENGFGFSGFGFTVFGFPSEVNMSEMPKNDVNFFFDFKGGLFQFVILGRVGRKIFVLVCRRRQRGVTRGLTREGIMFLYCSLEQELGKKMPLDILERKRFCLE